MRTEVPSQGTGRSPRESSRSQPVSIVRVAVVTVVVLVVLLSQARHLQEYWLYFTEDRKPASFSFQELSGAWSEKTLQERFVGHLIRCERYQGELPADRACAVDVESHNGVPVLFISFFFADGRLSDVSVNVPWWSHGTAYREVVAMLGAPQASQMFPGSGVRLHGWRLPSGAALFLNRDRPWNPLDWNALYWRSAASCSKTGCFTSGSRSSGDDIRSGPNS